MLNKKNLILMIFGISLLSGVGMQSSASAREREHEHGRGWHEGHWIHDRHEGRLGWWWVVGPRWVFYTRPYEASQTVIIQQVPPVLPAPVIVQTPALAAPAPAPIMYYCKATGTYYPDTLSCPGGWMQVSAGAPPVPTTQSP